jgi:hypothetical protein
MMDDKYQIWFSFVGFGSRSHSWWNEILLPEIEMNNYSSYVISDQVFHWLVVCIGVHLGDIIQWVNFQNDHARIAVEKEVGNEFTMGSSIYMNEHIANILKVANIIG